MSVFNNRFLPDKTIVGNGGNKPTSKVCSEWLMYLDDKHLLLHVALSRNQDVASAFLGLIELLPGLEIKVSMRK